MNIHIQMDFSIPDELVGVYQRLTEDEFLGGPPYLSLESAKEALEHFSKTKIYGGIKIMAIMKIWDGEKLIGISFPRKIIESHYRSLKLEGSHEDWYHLGTVFLDKEHRGKGVITEVIKLFRKTYPNLVWECEVSNLASKKSACKAGFLLSHDIFFQGSGEYWSFEPDEEFCFPYHVLKTKL